MKCNAYIYPKKRALQPKILFITLFCLVFISSKAQLCQGNLGDPVVNITFGAGPNPGPKLSAASTNYVYYGADCPNDGFYTVVNTSTACFGSSWHTVTKDHTGNANGYFMLVNASLFPGAFYLDTVRGLCPNTTFEFAAWLLNILLPSACQPDPRQPNITFRIETVTGTLLQSFTTGELPSTSSPQWNQYGFIFQTPGGVTDVVVRIINNAPGGCGNDLALDDITFRPCGPKVNATISGAGSNNIKDLCKGDTSNIILKSEISAGYTNPAFQWQQSTDGNNWTDIAGATSTSFTRTSTGTGNFYYRIAVAEAGNINSLKCRVVSNTVQIVVHDLPVTSASSNSPVCEGTTLSLTASGGSKYDWKGPNSYSGNGSPATINKVSPNAAGKYYVTVTTDKGCSQKDSVVVSITPKPTANAGTDANICEGATVTLNGSGGNGFEWSPATGLSAANISSPVASPTDSTIYILTVTDGNGCKDSDAVAVNVYKKPSANAGPDKVMIEGQSVQLSGSATGTNIQYNWTPNIFINDDNILTPTVSPPGDTTYTLHAVSNFGCGISSDDVFVKVYKKVIIPNAFSPNGDGINDVWNIEALDAYPGCDLIVFNRYGQAVYRSIGYTKKWDGTRNNKPLPAGTYYYLVDLKVDLPKLSGWVLILR